MQSLFDLVPIEELVGMRFIREYTTVCNARESLSRRLRECLAV